jgi:hypothetical protein
MAVRFPIKVGAIYFDPPTQKWYAGFLGSIPSVIIPGSATYQDVLDSFLRAESIDANDVVVERMGKDEFKVTVMTSALATLASKKCPGCDGMGSFQLLTSARQKCDRCGGSGRVP